MYFNVLCIFNRRESDDILTQFNAKTDKQGKLKDWPPAYIKQKQKYQKLGNQVAVVAIS